MCKFCTQQITSQPNSHAKRTQWNESDGIGRRGTRLIYRNYAKLHQPTGLLNIPNRRLHNGQHHCSSRQGCPHGGKCHTGRANMLGQVLRAMPVSRRTLTRIRRAVMPMAQLMDDRPLLPTQQKETQQEGEEARDHGRRNIRNGNFNGKPTKRNTVACDFSRNPSCISVYASDVKV